MPLQATSGAASQDAFGGNGVPIVPTYIEEVFSTWLYDGNGSSQTITNGIDLSTKGGLVWIKRRNGANSNTLINSATSSNGRYYLISDLTDAQQDTGTSTFPFTTSGFSLNSGPNQWNGAAGTYASWTFREQPKFFDIVTYTGTGSARTIAHNLGSVPGCIIVKDTSAAANWYVYHRSLATNQALKLNSTAAIETSTTFWNNTAATSTNFSLGTAGDTNGSGGTFVAYLFAHDAGGFGLTGTDNVISCGSYVGTGAVGNAVTLGYEPQWLMVKNRTAADDWIIYDNMRGMPASATNTGNTKFLKPNLFNAEAGGNTIAPTATGFEINTGASVVNTTGDTYIYIAIRRGPMKVPTTGTSVFEPATRTGTGANATITTAISPVDMVWSFGTNGGLGQETIDFDRLRGALQALYVTSAAEFSAANTLTGFDVQNGYTVGSDAAGYGINYSGIPFVNYNFKRAPSFFDEVCYTGNSTARTLAHNLTVVPELMIVKRRDAANNWAVYAAPLGNTNRVFINQTQASAADSTLWNDTTPTSSVFTVGTAFATNNSGNTYLAYLFATCAGVSKVGSYTGTATTKQIDCGFTAGARFVLIKRTDSTGDWYVWDTARGIVSGNDPYLLLNSTAAEVTNTDYIDTYSAGFEISSTAPAAINANGGSFIFFAVA